MNKHTKAYYRSHAGSNAAKFSKARAATVCTAIKKYAKTVTRARRSGTAATTR